ncbi:DUF4232 domain-containing protein [Rhodococcus hoagii]|uniref:DUF4232 domain-containing protein n=1 Tax=Rhodococcus hoagii TaxID=43767 RepID=A0AAE3BAE8_RHOHA|nr:DUF4232 domain-containing protein [Prescottella equi]
MSELRLTLGQGQGAAGRPSSLSSSPTAADGRARSTGSPGVSYVQGGADGAQVGAAATRSGESAGAVTLARTPPPPRWCARSRCRTTQRTPARPPVAGLRVYPPNDTGSIFVPYATTGARRQVTA